MKGYVSYWRELTDKKRVIVQLPENETAPATWHGPFKTARDARRAARMHADPPPAKRLA